MPEANILVVIVTYKTAELCVQALESILSERKNSTNLNISAVVIDNASGDTPIVSAAIENRQWGDWITLINSNKNGGFGYGNNLGFQYGFEQKKIDYFYLLNPDAYCTQDSIQHLVTLLETQPDAGIAGSSFYNEDGSLWPIAFRFPTLLGELDSSTRVGFISKLLSRWVMAVEMPQVTQPIDWIAGASMMIKADVVRQLRGFDENFFLYYEETDFCLRANRLGIQTWYVPQSKVVHIAGQSTKVTERKAARKRLPQYWYESRAIFYLKNYGFSYALLTELIIILVTPLSRIRLSLMAKKDETPLYYLTDLINNSCLRARTRIKKPFKSIFTSAS